MKRLQSEPRSASELAPGVDEQDLLPLGDLADRQRGGRVDLADEAGHAVALDHALGLGRGGLRIDAVLREQLDLPARDAAGGVDLLHRELGRLHGELPERAEEARARRQMADPDHLRLSLRERRAREGRREERRAAGAQKAAARKGIPVPVRHRSAPVRVLQPGCCGGL
ncbi:hypothetical protein ABIC20_004885 [Methylobacterium radiotolerans]|uniref:Uncharacterized protein n=1 Tax=Methylobacterium radiotolerans TaxID=31998 RepID=A0ABV2NM96_9HYPH